MVEIALQSLILELSYAIAVMNYDDVVESCKTFESGPGCAVVVVDCNLELCW